MFFMSKKNKTTTVAKNSKPVTQDVAASNTDIDWFEKDPLTFISSIINKDIDVNAIFFDATAFTQPQSQKTLAQASTTTLFDFVKKNNGRIFELVNRSILLIFRPLNEDELKAFMVQLAFTFHSELSQNDKESILQADFFNLYTDKVALEKLKEKIVYTTPIVPEKKEEPEKATLSEKFVSVLSGNKKNLRDLTPDILNKIQGNLQRVDFSSLIRRQAVCAVIGKSAPQMIFEEVYVSIPDLRDILTPDINLTSNPWLFMNLTETLDKRVLAHVSKHDDGSLVSNFSLNLNVSTILSDEFLAFDESISPSQRSTIILELQLVDIFNDVKAFLLAKAFAQYRGYKICIDGITVDKLQYINRSNLNSDFIKIIWHPSFEEVINKDTHFKDYVNRAERAKMILCRVDDVKAIEIGNSLGINMYQGRYVQRELNKYRK